MEKKQNILIIDTNPLLLSELEEGVKPLGFNLCRTTLPDGTIDQLDALSPKLAILGPSLKTETCMNYIHKLKILDPYMPILTSCDDICPSGGFNNTPFEGIHYLSQDSSLKGILKTIDSALKHMADCESLPDYPIIIGQGPEITSIRQTIQKISDKDITVLITGGSGTGKELIARSIHYHSSRNKGPLVKVNCATLPNELLESEIFGFQRGAFTGADRDKPGRLELAHNGTLFIDEVGDLSLSLQVKFLQVLEDKEFSRLGDTTEKVIDARIIAATNHDLWKEVKEGSFRKDIFYRLNVVNITAPPLRDRKDDIRLLTEYFLNKYCYELKRKYFSLPDKVIRHFEDYHWPGNVRELENIIRRIIVLRDLEIIYDELYLKDGDMKGEANGAFQEHVPQAFWSDNKIKEVFRDNDYSIKKTTRTFVSEVELQEILKALRLTEWNRKKAAEMLQISYKTLLNRITEFDLKP